MEIGVDMMRNLELGKKANIEEKPLASFARGLDIAFSCPNSKPVT